VGRKLIAKGFLLSAAYYALAIFCFLFYNNIKRCIIIFLEEKLFEEAAAKMIISMRKQRRTKNVR